MEPVIAGDLPIGPGYPPRIMGVLNVSIESPYDPSVFTDAKKAADYITDELVTEGADIVDIGLATANKRFEVLSADEELERLETAIAAIEHVDADVVFSIETRYASVADAALSGGFDMINDVCGFADSEMPTVCAQHDVPVVKMAGPGDIERPGALETVDEIYDALAREPLPEQTIIDPAFGGWSEAKDLEADRETFRRLREFQAIGRPMLVSINRKNFLRHLADRSTEQALPVSLAATAMAVERGADVIRTHDVAETRDAAVIGAEFSQTHLHSDDPPIRTLDVREAGELARHLERIGAGRAHAADGVNHVFELRELDPVDRSMLANLTEDVGATLAVGRETEAAILLASTRELGELQNRVGDESDVLAEVFEIMLESVG